MNELFENKTEKMIALKKSLEERFTGVIWVCWGESIVGTFPFSKFSADSTRSARFELKIYIYEEPILKCREGGNEADVYDICADFFMNDLKVSTRKFFGYSDKITFDKIISTAEKLIEEITL